MGTSSEYCQKLKRALWFEFFVTSAEKSLRRFFAQFSLAFADEFPAKLAKLRLFPIDAASSKLSGVWRLPCHSCNSVLWPGYKKGKTCFITLVQSLNLCHPRVWKLPLTPQFWFINLWRNLKYNTSFCAIFIRSHSPVGETCTTTLMVLLGLKMTFVNWELCESQKFWIQPSIGHVLQNIQKHFLFMENLWFGGPILLTKMGDRWEWKGIGRGVAGLFQQG